MKGTGRISGHCYSGGEISSDKNSIRMIFT
ncbi:hypothetical protein FRAHR75_130016 [Frankia sp. Hr75.2]|nr:hypothetical protein FRAHR75_130016 [Frankia sp. Hr75.2]